MYRQKRVNDGDRVSDENAFRKTVMSVLTKPRAGRKEEAIS